MKKVIDEINKLILEPKREKLIADCMNIVSGNQAKFIPYEPNPKYYEIWFYCTFYFNYIFLGQQNYAVNLANTDDEKLFEQINESFKLEETETWRIKKEAEFEFFKVSWKQMEKRLNRPVRAFLIEYGVIRGIDVNNGNFIEGEEIEIILNSEKRPGDNTA